ncbi:50S ribosomal protein L5 [Candidatus Micrarchaeota archaeon]|nr:50S ribosomal protein L5 [Candidatus Micrarchaeota archaeon]
MRDIMIEKVVVNIGVGEPGERLDNAKNLLSKLTDDRVPVETHAKKRQPSFKLRKGLAIGTMITLRGEEAKTFLEKALIAKRKILNTRNFDKQGNLSFGVHEYIDFPGVKYDPAMEMYGFDVCVSLVRPGKRVSLRKLKSAKIGKKHRISKEEAMEFVKNNFDVKFE